MVSRQNPSAVASKLQTPAAFLRNRFRAMVRHRKGVLAGRDPEAVHQMRVASRRLRAALAFFRSEVPGKRRRRASRAVTRITNRLGEVRQLDVSSALLDHLIAESPAARNAAEFARPLLAADRGRALVVAQRAIARTDFGKLRRRIQKVEKALRGCDTESLSDRARRRVSRRGKRLAALWGDNRAGPAAGVPADPKQPLHAIRIATKKLRYSLEAGQRICGWHPRHTIGKAREVQEVLGHLHDLEVLRHWCKARSARSGGPLHALARHIEEQETAVALGAVMALREAACAALMRPLQARPSRRAAAGMTASSTVQR